MNIEIKTAADAAYILDRWIEKFNEFSSFDILVEDINVFFEYFNKYRSAGLINDQSLVNIAFSLSCTYIPNYREYNPCHAIIDYILRKVDTQNQDISINNMLIRILTFYEKNQYPVEEHIKCRIREMVEAGASIMESQMPMIYDVELVTLVHRITPAAALLGSDKDFIPAFLDYIFEMCQVFGNPVSASRIKTRAYAIIRWLFQGQQNYQENIRPKLLAELEKYQIMTKQNIWDWINKNINTENNKTELIITDVEFLVRGGYYEKMYIKVGLKRIRNEKSTFTINVDADKLQMYGENFIPLVKEEYLKSISN